MMQTIHEEIRCWIQTNANMKDAVFQAKLFPNLPPESIHGIKTPPLRDYARKLAIRPDVNGFLEALPHKQFEEKQLHSFILSGMKDFADCMNKVDAYLPYVDNWATCDQLSPKVFRRHADELLPWIDSWLQSKHEYAVRFGIRMLMDYFLTERFRVEYLQKVAKVQRTEYYIKMMQAWYFATALAKQWEATIGLFEHPTLEIWVHNKAIQKAVESYRISEQQKDYLRTLRRREKY